MNLYQMQMVYDHAPNGKVILRQASPPLPFRNGHNRGCTRARQAEHREKKGGYRPGYSRPRHDCDWKAR